MVQAPADIMLLKQLASDEGFQRNKRRGNLGEDSMVDAIVGYPTLAYPNTTRQAKL